MVLGQFVSTAIELRPCHRQFVVHQNARNRRYTAQSRQIAIGPGVANDYAFLCRPITAEGETRWDFHAMTLPSTIAVLGM